MTISIKNLNGADFGVRVSVEAMDVIASNIQSDGTIIFNLVFQ